MTAKQGNCNTCGKKGQYGKVCKTRQTKISQEDTARTEAEYALIQLIQPIRQIQKTEKCIKTGIQIEGKETESKIDPRSPKNTTQNFNENIAINAAHRIDKEKSRKN